MPILESGKKKKRSKLIFKKSNSKNEEDLNKC